MVDRGSSKNMVLKNKRGILFTTITIILVFLFFISYTLYSVVKDRNSIQNRVESLNGFVVSVDEDLPRQIKTSSFRAIFILQKNIIETGNYISDLNSSFQELIFNGTLNGETSEEIESLMEDAKFTEIIDSMKERASKTNAEFEIHNPMIEIKQEDAWNLKITLKSNIIIRDKSNLSSWNKTEDISVLLPIENFEDPIYLVNTNGLVTNKIIKTPYDNFVSGSDLTNLSDHLQSSYYIENTDAPNFINRIQGVDSSDPTGIESLVYLPKLSGQGITLKDKSVVDHIYFSNDDPSTTQVSGMPAWFKLDSDHLSQYNL